MSVATSPPAMMALPSSTGTRSMTPLNGAYISVWASSARAVCELRLGGGKLGTRLVGLQLRSVAALDQPLGRIGLRLALGNEHLGHLDGRFLVLGVEPHDEIALVDVIALADRKLLDDRP